jgi:hypothetical protein
VVVVDLEFEEFVDGFEGIGVLCADADEAAGGEFFEGVSDLGFPFLEGGDAGGVVACMSMGALKSPAENLVEM